MKEQTFPLPPLIRAIECEDIRDIETLISIGANVDARDEWNDTALVNAIQIEEEHTRFAIVEMLLESQANPKLLCEVNLGPLFEADYLQLLRRDGAKSFKELQ